MTVSPFTKWRSHQKSRSDKFEKMKPSWKFQNLNWMWSYNLHLQSNPITIPRMKKRVRIFWGKWYRPGWPNDLKKENRSGAPQGRDSKNLRNSRKRPQAAIRMKLFLKIQKKDITWKTHSISYTSKICDWHENSWAARAKILFPAMTPS